MKRIIFIIIIGVVLIITVKFSTRGCRFWKKTIMDTFDNTQSANRLKNHVCKLSDEIGDRNVFTYEKLKDAEEYITNQFRSYGYNVEYQNYITSNKEVKNIIATKRGQRNPGEIIIVGAHYDTCFNPGADDNASAVAGLLELARNLSDHHPNRTIKFIAFVNEEPPFFQTKDMGSYVYAKEAKKRGENIQAVLIMEMIGYYSDKPGSQEYPPLYGLFYPNTGNFIGVLGNMSSHKLVKKIISNFKKETSFPIESVISFGLIPGADFSDHWSFWKEGYRAVMITDTSFYRNPHYHSDTDTYETLNYKNMAEVVTGLTEAITALANE